MEKKIRIGIDINEVLRARWLQFDKFYVEEFGGDETPEYPYVYDFFKEYNWEDTEKTVQMFNEDLPDDINPMDYQIDPKTGEAPVDYLAFSSTTESYTAKEMYNKFMYEDYNFEIHGSAPIMYKQMDLHAEKFYLQYKDCAEFVILSQENWFSIPPTLFFLSRIFSRFKNYRFVEDKQEMWDNVDVLITTDPEILDAGTPEGKEIIKLNRPYNTKSQDGALGGFGNKLVHLYDLVDDEKREEESEESQMLRKEFQKIISYNPKIEENE
jgi:hypothetical protein